MVESTLSLCTVTFNNEDNIEKFIRNVEEVLKGHESTLFIVDNGSTDNTIDVIKKLQCEFSNIKLRQPEFNKGFGAGNNFILKELSSDYHIVLNSDIIIDSYCELCKMIDYMNNHNEIGLLSPKLLNLDGTVQKLYKHNPSLLDMGLRFISPKIMTKRQAWFVHDESGYNQIGMIEHASGAFMLFRTSIFKDIQGFDERYFMYMEDADITREVNQISRAMYYPSSTITHEWQRDSHKKFKYMMMTFNSMKKYFMKWGWKIW